MVTADIGSFRGDRQFQFAELPDSNDFNLSVYVAIGSSGS
jgi:hypothetical protein